MIRVDGSMGEGGGQVLRSSLAMSLLTGEPVVIESIRANRKKPGLRRQHLAAVRAAATIGGAEVEGASMGSRRVVLRPSGVYPGTWRFAIGTAGSTALVLQALLPALVVAGGPSRVTIEGGTHNPLAPSYDFLARCLCPLIGRMGPSVRPSLAHHGFFPAGGGKITVEIGPVASLAALDLHERGAVEAIHATAILSSLPGHVARRELDTLGRALRPPPSTGATVRVADPVGPGNALVVDVVSPHLTEVFTGHGKKGLPAEVVAKQLAAEVQAHVDRGVPVGPHLADQLLIFLAVAGRGGFRTGPLTRHTTTQIALIRMFLGVEIRVEEAGDGVVDVSV